MTEPARPTPNFWQRFWHEPLRAESLGLFRFCLAFCLLFDQLLQYLPYLSFFFGPEGMAPAGMNDEYVAYNWRWTILFFHTDDMTIISIAFFAWMAVTIGMMLGWQTRIMTPLVWFGFLCFLNRNPNLKNGGDDLCQIMLFILMFAPCGRGFSLDARRRKKKRSAEEFERSLWIAPWSIRLIQIQMCVMYLATGLAKIVGDTWRDGTSIYYVMLDYSRTRLSYAQLPVPFAITELLTYATLGFEIAFWLFVLIKPLRKWILFLGVGFHIGIWFTLEVGWFSFYSLCLYAVWIPSAWWERRDRRFAGNSLQKAVKSDA